MFLLLFLLIFWFGIRWKSIDIYELINFGLLKKIGKIVIIIGGIVGIGKEIVRILVFRKVRVIIGCRNVIKGL